MKNLAKLSLIIFFFTCTVNAQNIVDNNTEDIQNYFYQDQDTNKNLTKNNQNSDVVIYQQGNQNEVEILSSGDKIQLVRQVGDDNNYQYYSFYDSSKANLNINQFGDDNDIQIYGHNSIVEKLKITQTTSNQSILIFNY
jgi:hypothetical protein